MHTINQRYQVFILTVIERHLFVENRNCWAKLKKLNFLVLLRKNWFFCDFTNIKMLISLNILGENAWNFLTDVKISFLQVTWGTIKIVGQVWKRKRKVFKLAQLFYCLKDKAVILKSKWTTQKMGWWYTNVTVHFGGAVTHLS